jgi:hypothetical protein
MPVYVWPAADTKHQEEKQLPLPLLTVGNNDIVVTWDNPYTSSTSYGIFATIEQGTVSIGQIRPVIKQGSVTTTGCTITVVNSAVVSLAAGAVLHVLSIEG